MQTSSVGMNRAIHHFHRYSRNAFWMRPSSFMCPFWRRKHFQTVRSISQLVILWINSVSLTWMSLIHHNTLIRYVNISLTFKIRAHLMQKDNICSVRQRYCSISLIILATFLLCSFSWRCVDNVIDICYQTNNGDSSKLNSISSGHQLKKL